ncbi:MAG: hypothetical protein A3J28_17980 [Acidobacteria bacterium RIFCSPLOWO2_12_FULL_60_22]|nr:MAG: hypothetical protein A3J28_17980 [Acidobacteria bacterium RIFCSPLOWO2_12_FULL_60_22]
MSRHIICAKRNRGALILLMAVAMIASSRFPVQAQDTSITGVVRSAAGEPVAGALVKVRSEELGLGFMVVSQTQGRYSTPHLLPGLYKVHGFGGTHQSESRGPVEVKSGQQGKMDLVLTAPLQIPPRVKRMTDADFEKLLPEGDAKRVVAGKCGYCHNLLPVLSARKTREKWQETVDRMYDNLLGIHKPLISLSDEEREYNVVVPDYLAKNFGPDSPQDSRVVSQWFLRREGPSHLNRNLPGTLLQGAAAKYVAMEFTLPPGAAPRDITVDSQGIVWVSETNTGKLGRFDPHSLTYSHIASPPGNDPKVQLNAVTVDPLDQVWLADDGPNARVLRYDPKSGEFDSYPMPEYPYPVPDNIPWARIGTLRFLNGYVWATGLISQRILRLNPKTRKIVQYAAPRGSSPFGLALGGDKMIWYSARIGNVVVRLNPGTDRLEPHLIPEERSDLRGLAADADGNLWVAALETGKLLKLDYRTGNFTEYTPPTEDSGPFAIDVDTKRNLIWFSEIFSDKIGRFDPSTNTFVEFPHPLADSDVRRIAIDRTNPNRVWWSSNRGDKIGYLAVVE